MFMQCLACEAGDTVDHTDGGAPFVLIISDAAPFFSTALVEEGPPEISGSASTKAFSWKILHINNCMHCNITGEIVIQTEKTNFPLVSSLKI